MAKQATELLVAVTNFYISQKPCWLDDLDVESAISRAQTLCLVDTQSAMSKFESAVAQGATSALENAAQIAEVLRTLCSSLDRIRPGPTNPDDSPEIIDQTATDSDQSKVVRYCRARHRIISILIVWIRDFWEDFESSSGLLDTPLYFLQSMETDASSRQLFDEFLQALIAQLKPGSGSSNLLPDVPTPPPEPLIFRELLRAQPEDFDPFCLEPLEFARQLTLVDHDLFRAIKPRELLSQNWNSSQKTQHAPNVTAVISRVNSISLWVMNSIVLQTTRRNRTRRIERWLRVASCCLSLNNLNGVSMILSGLLGTCVYRLRKSWRKVEPSSLHQLEELKTLLSASRNYAAYRSFLRSLTPPCVPYIGPFLTDLTFTDDMMPTFKDPEVTVINFEKQLKLSNLIDGLLQFQTPPYNLRSVPFIESLIRTKWTDSQALLSAEALLLISKAFEP